MPNPITSLKLDVSNVLPFHESMLRDAPLLEVPALPVIRGRVTFNTPVPEALLAAADNQPMYDVFVGGKLIGHITQSDAAAMLERGPSQIKAVGYSTLHFNVKAQKYYFPKGSGSHAGKFLSNKAVRDAIEEDIAAQTALLDEYGQELQSAGLDLIAGKITEREYRVAVMAWRQKMYFAIKNIHLNYAMAARGGFHRMGPVEYGRVGGLLKFHLQCLNDFAKDLVRNPQILFGGVDGKMAFAQRYPMYAKTALYTFERERVASHAEQGCKFYRNVPHSKESCTTDHKHGTMGCVEITAMQKQPIGTLVDIGKRTCKGGDLCTWEFIWD